MKPEVYIRADASMDIGMGHIVRCIALAHMLKEWFNIVFFSKALPSKIEKILLEGQFGLTLLAEENSFLEALHPDNIVVLDGYDFDTDYQKKIKKLGCKLVCIDDLHDKFFVADLIINHAPGIKEEDYRTEGKTWFALGSQYALLRPSFLAQAGKRKVIDKIDTVLIAFGGSDNQNLTKSTLKAILSYTDFKKIIVVTGAFYSHYVSLRQLVETDKRIFHCHAIDEEEMFSLMLEAHLAIVPASGMLYEVLAAGCRVVSGMYVHNQKNTFEHFLALNAFVSADDFSADNLKKAIEEVIRLPDNNLKIIDGKSGKNNLLQFLNLASVVRELRPDDCKLLFDWANDFENRQNAISSDLISWEDHVAWFNARINSPDSKIFILEFADAPIGQVRYDKKDECWMIDYSVSNKFRGFGFGKLLLIKTLSFVGGNKIKAIVKDTNIASSHVFLFSEFKKISSGLINDQTYTTYQLQT